MAGADLDGDNLISKEEWIQYFDPIPDNEVRKYMRVYMRRVHASDATQGLCCACAALPVLQI